MTAVATTQHVKAFGADVAEYLSRYRYELDGYQWPMTEKCRKAAVLRGLLSDTEFGGGLAETMSLRRSVAAQARALQKEAVQPNLTVELTTLAEFVISDWGNLNGNKRETIRRFVMRLTGSPIVFDAVKSHHDLCVLAGRRKRGLFNFSGIASWSKWLSFVWSDWALIYDARIAFALDAIHFISRTDAPVLPVPPGRNGLLASFDAESAAALAWLGHYGGPSPGRQAIGAEGDGEGGQGSELLRAWLKTAIVSRNEAYTYYLDVMAEAHRQIWSDQRPLVQTEMLLFKISTGGVARDFTAEFLRRMGG